MDGRWRQAREGRGLHGLPWRARDPGGQRSQVADLQVQRAGDLRKVPPGGRDSSSCRAFTGRRSRGAMGRLRCARTATAFTRSRRTSIRIRRSRHRTLRETPAPAAMRECGSRRSSAFAGKRYRPTWTAITGWRREAGIAGGGQLLQLPRRAQHSAVERSAFDDQPGQPGEDLRPVPPGSDGEVYAEQGARGCACSRPTSGSVAVRWVRRFYMVLILAVIGAMFLHNLDHLADARRLRGGRAENPLVTRMTRISAGSTWLLLMQLHRAGDHRICA